MVIAEILHSVWFAALLGWMSGQHEQSEVVNQVSRAAKLVLKGADVQP